MRSDSRSEVKPSNCKLYHSICEYKIPSKRGIVKQKFSGSQHGLGLTNLRSSLKPLFIYHSNAI